MLHLRKIRDYTQVIDEVRAHILDNRGGHVTAETLANMFRVRIGIIHRCLHKLNLEGLVYKKSRHYAHDTNRNPMFDGSESGWGANVYCIKEAVET
jgi:DNA-binding transcriptional regulator YhcF (GntR family)